MPLLRICGFRWVIHGRQYLNANTLSILVFQQNVDIFMMEFHDLYTLGEKLGEGRFGTTYLCVEIATGSCYACKVISKWKTTSPTHSANLKREIDILRLIKSRNHPNIISIVDVFEDNFFTYVVMELCEGGELYNRVDECGPFTEPKAAKLIKDITSAIKECHSVGIVHRDLKLENVLFQIKDEDSVVKVVDFGLAQRFQRSEVLKDVVGSPLYVAPEVMEGHHGPKADIWSAGVVLYILLARFPPFRANTLRETYEKVMRSHGIPFDRDPWPNISEGAKDLIRKMLKYDVNERWSASEVLQHPWIKENTK